MLVEEKDALKERLKEIFGYSQFRGNQEDNHPQSAGWEKYVCDYANRRW